MKNHLLTAILLLAPVSTCFAVILEDFSYIEATGAFGPHISANHATAYFPAKQNITGHRTNDGSFARAQLDYEATENRTSASFDFQVDLQGTHTGPLHNSTAQVYVSLSLQLNEPMAYAIGGALNCTTDISDVKFFGHWVLFDSYGSYYYQKQKWAFDSAILEADDLPDPWPIFPSEATGILPASTYSFLFIAMLDTTRAPGSTAHVSGFTTLTLSRLVPEPGSIALFTALFIRSLLCRRIPLSARCLRKGAGSRFSNYILHWRMLNSSRSCRASHAVRRPSPNCVTG
jgi:hypothetical protein